MPKTSSCFGCNGLVEEYFWCATPTTCLWKQLRICSVCGCGTVIVHREDNTRFLIRYLPPD